MPAVVAASAFAVASDALVTVERGGQHAAVSETPHAQHLLAGHLHRIGYRCLTERAEFERHWFATLFTIPWPRIGHNVLAVTPAKCARRHHYLRMLQQRAFPNSHIRGLRPISQSSQCVLRCARSNLRQRERCRKSYGNRLSEPQIRGRKRSRYCIPGSKRFGSEEPSIDSTFA